LSYFGDFAAAVSKSIDWNSWYGEVKQMLHQ